uniref:Uncharacterized protein LOC114335280 n=1 Tax=Diabrotica virgifera virgifera TaxID=50390 RepID=A0A6P7GA18_DIAVI
MGTPNLQGDPIIKVNQVATEIMRVQSEQKLNEVINLTNDNLAGMKSLTSKINEANHHPSEAEGFTSVKRKTRKTRNHNIDSGDGDENFQGIGKTEKKIWLFLSRVPDTVTEYNIKAYITKQSGEQNTYVKKLPTYFVRSNNQAFMIGVDPSLQEKLYEKNFWPKNVYFSRFNFRQGQRFLEHPQPQPRGNFSDQLNGNFNS